MNPDRRSWRLRPPWLRWGGTLGLLVAVTGCPPPGPPAEDMPEDGERLDPTPEVQDLDQTDTRAELIDGQGNPVGEVRFARAEQGAVHASGSLHLPELAGGARGFHIHEMGACEPPDFESAGDHFNPHGTPHGGPNDPPGERHVGDLGNLAFDAEGRAQVDLVDSVISLDADTESIRGLAIVVHENEDDLVTQPSGDAGDPAACGVIEA